MKQNVRSRIKNIRTKQTTPGRVHCLLRAMTLTAMSRIMDCCIEITLSRNSAYLAGIKLVQVNLFRKLEVQVTQI